MNAIAAYEATKWPKKRLAALMDVLTLCAFSLLPPDRVGVIRLLKFGYTLKWEADDDQGEEAEASNSGAYYIDLRDRSARHKTTRVRACTTDGHVSTNFLYRQTPTTLTTMPHPSALVPH